MAATGLIGASRIALNLEHRKAVDLSTVLDSLKADWGVNWTFGVGANQINALFHDTRSLAATTPETIDINDGSLTGPLGETVTFEALKLLCIRNNGAGNLQVGGAAATQLGLFVAVTDIIIIKPGGVLLWIDPTAGGLDCSTNSDLKIENMDTAVATYDIVAGGLD